MKTDRQTDRQLSHLAGAVPSGPVPFCPATDWLRNPGTSLNPPRLPHTGLIIRTYRLITPLLRFNTFLCPHPGGQRPGPARGAGGGVPSAGRLTGGGQSHPRGAASPTAGSYSAPVGGRACRSGGGGGRGGRRGHRAGGQSRGPGAARRSRRARPRRLLAPPPPAAAPPPPHPPPRPAPPSPS